MKPAAASISKKPAKSAPSPQSGRKASAVDDPPPDIPAGQREGMIATAAYFRAERRSFAPGDELADWLAAEAEIDRTLTASLRA